MSSVKTFHKGAFKLETGDNAWGSSMQDITGDVAIPFLSLGKDKQIDKKSDNSIDSLAFKDIPRKVGETVENDLTMNARIIGLNHLLYWAFGFENEIISVVVFKVDSSTGSIEKGDVYLDESLNSLTFYRREDNSNGTYLVFKASDYDGTDLSRDTGTGPETIDSINNSGIMYEHYFELDRNERHLTDYRLSEQIDGYSSDMKKNRRANIGIALGPNDLVYPQAMCNSFGFKSSSANFAEYSFSFLAYNQNKGDYNSSSWDYAEGMQDNDDVIAHHQMEIALGPDSGSLVKLGVTTVDLGVEIPLQAQQDTLSGLYIAEPLMEGKYDIKCGITLSRYSSDIYQQYRDHWNSVVAKISSFSGYLRNDFFVQSAKISEAGPDDSDVSQEPLTLEVGAVDSNNWDSDIDGSNLIQKSPLVLMVRDYDSTNSMLNS